MKSRFKTPRHFTASFIIAALTFIPSAQAATYYWNTTTTADWTNGANWSDDAATGGVTGTVPTIADPVVFNQSSVNGNESVQLSTGAGGSALGLTFGNTGTTTLVSDGGSNRVLNIGTSGITINSGAGAVTIGNPGVNMAVFPVLTGGTQQTWTNNSTNLLTVANTISNSAKALTIAGSGDTTLNGSLDGNLAGLTKTGAGTLTLTAANSYGVSTTINGGKIALSGGNNRLPSTLPVSFNGGNSSTATLDIGSTSQSLSAITFPATGLTTTMAADVDGSGGTLTVNGTATDLQLGPAGNNAQGTTIDMSGLSNFIYNSSLKVLRIGYQSGYGGNSANSVTASNVTLANTSNTITAATLAINDVAGSSGAGNALLHLGTTNTINASIINMGTGGRSGATLNFATGLTSPTVKLRGTDTTSAVTTWSTGQVNLNGANITWTQLADFTAGTIDANVTTMNVGKADFGAQTGRGGTNNATVIVGATTGANFTVGSLNLGYINGSATNALVAAGGSASGIFTLNSASGIVNTTTINFAKDTLADTSGAPKTVTGTFNLTNGRLNATTVQKDADTGTATATVNFNWTTGTIANITGTDLNFTKVPIKLLTTASHTFDISGSNTAIIDVDSPISGATFGITKTGTGTLALNAVNTYTGDTNVNDGILAVNGGSIVNTAKLVISGGKVNAAGSETVGTLFFGGAQQAAGTWGSSSSSAVAPFVDDARFSGTGVVIVASGPVGGYASWKGLNAGGQTPDLDWDNDGVSNGVEYFMNAAAGFTANPALNASNSITWSNGGNIATTAYSTQYVLQTSGDLVIWTDVPAGSLTANTSGPGGSLTYTLTGTGPRFVRLKVAPN